MASIRITIETDGAAFDDGEQPVDVPVEIVKILHLLANEYLRGFRFPRDIFWNGNVCGKVEVIE